MIIEINPNNIDSRAINQAVEILKKGGLVIFPTDSVYAIGCDLYNKKALDKLAKSFGTDKSSDNHNYCVKYEKYLPFNRYDNLNILEIGVLDGKSLLTWKDYYYRSNILGVDINPDCKKYEEERIKVEIGSQADNVFLLDIMREYGPFDMIGFSVQ